MPCARTQSAALERNTWKLTRLIWSGGVQADARLPFDALISTAWYMLSCCLGSLPRRKRSAVGRGAVGRGQQARGHAHPHLDDAIRLGPALHGQPVDRLGQHLVQDRRGGDRAVGQLHRLVVAVARPDADRDLRRVAHRPGVAPFVGRAGLGCHGPVGQGQVVGVGAERDRARAVDR